MNFEHVKTFVVHVEPMGAVRQNRSDVWRKRPAVLRHRATADAIRQVVGNIPVPDELECLFFFPMPKSWSVKKTNLQRFQPHKQKPDTDNCLKLVADALWADDSAIWSMIAHKNWRETPCIQITCRYQKQPDQQEQHRHD